MKTYKQVQDWSMDFYHKWHGDDGWNYGEISIWEFRGGSIQILRPVFEAVVFKEPIRALVKFLVELSNSPGGGLAISIIEKELNRRGSSVGRKRRLWEGFDNS